MAWFKKHTPFVFAEATMNGPQQNIVKFPRVPSDVTPRETELVALIAQAADVIRGIEERQDQIEQRHTRLTRDAEDRLQHAQSEIAAYEVQLALAEERARKAEARATELEDAFVRVEAAVFAFIGKEPNTNTVRTAA